MRGSTYSNKPVACNNASNQGGSPPVQTNTGTPFDSQYNVLLLFSGEGREEHTHTNPKPGVHLTIQTIEFWAKINTKVIKRLGREG